MQLVDQWILDNMTARCTHGILPSACEDCSLVPECEHRVKGGPIKCVHCSTGLPTRLALLNFFLSLNSPTLTRYLEMTDGTGLTSLLNRHNLHRLLRQSSEGTESYQLHIEATQKAAEYLSQVAAACVGLLLKAACRRIRTELL